MYQQKQEKLSQSGSKFAITYSWQKGEVTLILDRCKVVNVAPVVIEQA